MKRIFLKVIGYMLVSIGIIGGLSTINLIFTGDFAIWIILVIFFCGIGVVSLSVSKHLFNVESNKKDTNSNTIQGLTNRCINLKKYSKKVYNSIRKITVTIDHIYLKIVLTIIAILILIIAVELNHRLSEISYILYRK